MRLRALIAGMPAAIHGDDPEVAQIAHDAARVIPGSAFVAIKGVARDGHDFLPEAVGRGAAALVVEDAARVPAGFTGAVVVVGRGRDALNHLAARFAGDPGLAMFCACVTGTDGKTTIAWMTEAVLTGVGVPTGVIGTVDHHFGAHTWPGDTTPPPLALQARLARFRELGARAVALEATSQGLSQSRVGSVPLDVAIFSNLTRDHLDYHGTLEAYFEAKERLFTEVLAATPKPRPHAIVNLDTAYGARVRVPDRAIRWTYGARGRGADLEYELCAGGLAASVFRLRGWGEEAELRLPMMGAWNGANALAAIAVGVAAGHRFRACVDALARFAGVPGRVERVGDPAGVAVFVDYAHDPDAFTKVLGTARAAMADERPGGRLVTVFGCGGDRDRGKRPLMLAAALAASDRIVITADNPRSEDPRAIVDDILAGATAADRARIVVELDRAAAIEQAIATAADDDVVMLLGKGHEPYQQVGDRKLPHDERALATAALARRR